MKLNTNIGVIGNGFVGSAVRFGFSSQTGCDTTVRVYDKDESKSLNTLEETVNKSDIIFLKTIHTQQSELKFILITQTINHRPPIWGRL